MIFRLFAFCGVSWIASAADPAVQSEVCTAEDCAASSPALVQMRSAHAKKKQRTGSAHETLFGVKVLNFHRAWKTGVPAAQQTYDLNDDEDADWIVTFDDKAHQKDIDNFCKDVEEQGGQCTGRGHPDQGGIEVAAITCSKEHLAGLLEKYEEEGLVTDIEPEAEETASDMDPQLNPPWGLDRVDQDDIPYDNSYTPLGNAGRDISVYVLDTGVRASHNDFNGRSIPAYDATTRTVCNGDMNCAGDGHGHGTHCAGSVGGDKYGVAKRSLLRGVKVLGDNGGGSRSDVMAGIDWVGINKVGGRAIMSMSLGGSGQSPAYMFAFRRLLDGGVVTVVAAGNANHDACRYSPAFAPAAITVAASTSVDGKAGFSNYGPCIDIWAPGHQITSATSASDTSEATWSGTSMACPHVSGVVAVAFSNMPDLDAKQVSHYLDQTALRDKIQGCPEDTKNRLLRVSSAASNPTPAPVYQAGTWVIHGDGCQQVENGRCIQSLNYPSNYGAEETCRVILHDVTINFEAFRSEQRFDFLHLIKSETEYYEVSGNGFGSHQANFNGLQRGDLFWRTDVSGSQSGWKMCRDEDATPPPNEPTPMGPQPTPMEHPTPSYPTPSYPTPSEPTPQTGPPGPPGPPGAPGPAGKPGPQGDPR